MNKTMFLVLTAICVIALGYYASPVFGDSGQTDHAHCDISVTVDSIIEWDAADFTAIDLDTAESHIIAQGTSPQGTSLLSLWMNCNVSLSADNTAAAQLYHSRGGGANEDTLVTKYMITTDEAGVTASGATVGDVAASNSSTLRTHDNFLTTPLVVTHFNTDGRVEITLTAEATNDADNAADVGLYQATQTITATWIEDN